MTGHPHRIRFYYRLLQLVYLRSRICHRHLREILAGLDPGSVILDAGCGEGQFLIPAAQQYPGLSFVGMDLRTTHISFLQKLKNDQNLLRSEEHTSELQSRGHLVCRLLLEKKKYHIE